MSSLHVVALISGGKDSLFSILHCQANGHRVVALANLHPPVQSQGDAAEDVDSYMYQTIGHAVIPLYEKALGLPLYRQEILGDATVRARDYAADDTEDETESLMPLLRKVMAAHPEINAVSTGAILSDYQRTRVESVALRLGLTPLSYLWQYPSLPPHTQTSLLEDMAAVRQDAKIIKVASGGLDESFLWQNVADPRVVARLTKASQRFGTSGDGAVLGEGGEFETLAVSGPPSLWKGSISVPPEGIQTVPGEAGSASVRISQARVVLQDDIGTGDHCSGPPRIPPLLETRFDSIFDKVRTPEASDGDREAREHHRIAGIDEPTATDEDVHVIDNIVGGGATPAEQTRSIMDQAKTQIEASGKSFSDVTYSIIILRNMDDFTAVNRIYGSYFTRPNPPARVTIACADVLPTGASLTISIFCAKGSREGLHVQSRSYWAPANIGPYSQAVKVSQGASQGSKPTSVYIAGQIPLEPASMQLPTRSDSPSADFARQSVLAIQHLNRIGTVMKVDYWTFGIAFIASVGLDEQELNERGATAWHTWKAFHSTGDESTNQQGSTNYEDEDEDEGFDVWHLKHGSSKPWLTQMQSNPYPEIKKKQSSGVETARLIVITADSLPRSAAIEWVGYGGSAIEPGTPVHLRSLLHTFRHRIIPSPCG